MKTQINIVKKRDALEAGAGAAFEKAILKCHHKQGRVVVGLCGGRSVSGIFGWLSRRQLPWKSVHMFMLDEKLEGSDLNYSLVTRHLTKPLLAKGWLEQGNVHPLQNSGDASQRVEEYTKELCEFGGCYDIILASSGEDGHIGALYPLHHSVQDDSEYFVRMADAPKAPPCRMTASRRLILRSGTAVLIFLGEAKRKALEGFMDVRRDFYSCPAKLLKDIPECLVFTDLSIGK